MNQGTRWYRDDKSPYIMSPYVYSPCDTSYVISRRFYVPVRFIREVWYHIQG
jgi:hypothetical protein